MSSEVRPAGSPRHARIRAIDAWPILDSRGYPTIRVRVQCENDVCAVADAPAGVSRGSREVAELRDGQGNWSGLGVDRAVAAACGPLFAAVDGRDVRSQHDVDEALRAADGTADLSRYGGNTIVAISAAVARCGAIARSVPLFEHLGMLDRPALPIPVMTMFNGGRFGDETFHVQECALVLHGAATMAERIRMGAEIYAVTQLVLHDYQGSTSVGDTGGFLIDGLNLDAALRLLEDAVRHAGYRIGADVALGLDAAASTFFDHGVYRPEPDVELDSQAMVDWWVQLADRHPIALIEDPLDEDDTSAWKRLTARIGASVKLVGDDLFVTDAAAILHADTERIANAVVIKPNQAGTITDALAAIRMAHGSRYDVVVAARSGDTGDTLIADLAWAAGAQYVKYGAPARGERAEKYNRLLEIERLHAGRPSSAAPAPGHVAEQKRSDAGTLQ